MSLQLSKRFGQIIVGTDKIQGSSCRAMIGTALKEGYRIFDTAQAYNNEEDIGAALTLTSTIKRHEVFLIVKVSNGWHSNPQTINEAYQSVQRSLHRLQTRCADLTLIHAPGDSKDARRATWHALERLQANELTRYIGVSNFGIMHLLEMASYSSTGPPSVNQIELNPWRQQHQLVQYCSQHGIALQAYRCIARNAKANDPKLLGIARKYGRPTPQILLRYAIQRGWTPVVKAGNFQHLRENVKTAEFALELEDIATMNSWERSDS